MIQRFYIVKGHIKVLLALLLPSMLLFWCSNRSVERIAREGKLVTMGELVADTVGHWDDHLGYMPEPCVDMHVNYLGTNYGRVFNDSNYIHHEMAERFGIEPLTDLRSHWTQTRGLHKIVSCRNYYVEDLKYSRPYLTAEAAEMLDEIGRRFRDTIDARGGGHYRIKVTSILRTPGTVARLRRRNVNAVDSSVHTLATTVDISHSSFICDDDSVARSVNDLKGVLSEVLYAMRAEGKCLVKIERKQPCFHITACAKNK